MAAATSAVLGSFHENRAAAVKRLARCLLIVSITLRLFGVSIEDVVQLEEITHGP